MHEHTIRDIVEQATRAPSIHNTQPWRFVERGETIEVWTDPTRGLQTLDPTGRSRHISCGAALLQTRLAAAAAGYGCSVDLQPDAAEPAHLADVALHPATTADAECDLAAAIPARHTYRAAFDDVRVDDETIRVLRLAAEAEGAWLHVVTPADATAVAVLLSHADDVETADPAYVEELRRWTHREGATDGVPASAVPLAAPAQRGSDYQLRDFVADRAQSAAPARDPLTVERQLVAVLGTDDDDVRAWIMAGQALGRLLLTATLHGVNASPLTQVLEFPSSRARLTSELGLLGYPQMLLRLGYSTGAAPTPRRPLADVLTKSSG